MRKELLKGAIVFQAKSPILWQIQAQNIKANVKAFLCFSFKFSLYILSIHFNLHSYPLEKY